MKSSVICFVSFWLLKGSRWIDFLFFCFFWLEITKTKILHLESIPNNAPKRFYNSNLLFQGLLGRYALGMHERTWMCWWWTPLQSKSLDHWIACLSLYINTPNFSSLMMWDSQHSNVELNKGFYFSSSPYNPWSWQEALVFAHV